MHVDDDDVEVVARDTDGGRHPGRLQDIDVEGGVGQRDDAHPRWVGGRDLIEGLAWPALVFIAPAVGDRPDRVDAE